MTNAIIARVGSPWRRLWQVPLLLLGVVVFALGLKLMLATRKPVPFETHTADIRGMLERKDYADAVKQIGAIQPYFTSPAQQAELEVLAGDAFFLAQQDQNVLVRDNFEKAIGHYQRSVNLGLKESDAVKEHWGVAALGLGDYAEAIKRLEEVGGHDPKLLTAHARELVKAYLASEPPAQAKAVGLLDRIANDAGTEVDERVWALGKRIEVALGGGGAGLEKALEEGKAALGTVAERDPAGTLRLWIGRGEFERGRLDEARKYLTEARGKFVVHNLDDGRAALLLGKIAQAKGELDDAAKLYQEVVTSHAGSPIMAAGRLGRAEVLALQGTPNDQMKADYHDVIRELMQNKGMKGREGGGPEMVSAEVVRTSLETQQQRYKDQKRYAEALVFLELTKDFKEAESVDLMARRAETEERRGDELAAQAEAAKAPAERNDLLGQSLEHYGAAADAYLRYADATTIKSDELSATSLWKAAQLFDKSGRTERSIELYRRFVRERPRDPASRVPEALHRIGMLYQSLGKFEEAIPYYQRNIAENPKTIWSYASTLQLARCYMTEGEAGTAKAEQTLLGVVEGDSDLGPEANEFRVSLFTLGELYYRTRRWSDAILRLEEAITRYPQDKGVPRAMFWLGDSYRRSAAEIADAVKKDPRIAERDQLERSRQDRLRRAAALFGDMINRVDPDVLKLGGGKGDPLSGLEEDYLRQSYLNRADCLFELGDYSAAVKQYDQAATRFPQTLAAMQAYVQVVNSYLAMKEPAQARAAAERARWMLQRIPDEALEGGTLPAKEQRDFYDKFLKLSAGA